MLRSQVQWRCEVLVVGLMVAIGCGPQARTTTVVRSGPPVSADKAALLTYADSLDYWDRLGAADRRPVDPEGVLARIEPEVDAYRISESSWTAAALSPGSARVGPRCFCASG